MLVNAVEIAQSGMQANQTMVTAISNNVANMQTTAFKRTAVDFNDMVARGAAESSAEPMVLSGVSAQTKLEVSSQGNMMPTGNGMHVAIFGQGFIAIELENGEQGYTRVGQLAINQQGYLSAASGQKLSANIAIPPDASEMKIGDKGDVLVRLGNEANYIEIGTIELTRFTNPESLQEIGNGIYLATAQSGERIEGVPGEEGIGSLHQGYLESSNVDLINELTQLMLAQRGYQLNARVVQTADQLMETVNNLIR